MAPAECHLLSDTLPGGAPLCRWCWIAGKGASRVWERADGGVRQGGQAGKANWRFAFNGLNPSAPVSCRFERVGLWQASPRECHLISDTLWGIQVVCLEGVGAGRVVFLLPP